jgi:hypothetical protein
LDVAFDELLQRVDGHSFWMTYLSKALEPGSPLGIHLAIFSEPFLSMVLSGKKTIESRFSRNRCAPYGEVGDGDVILLKEVAGPICGIVLARQFWYFDLDSEPMSRIRDRFGAEMGVDETFWSTRADSLYATLIKLDSPASIFPLTCDKRDRRGWVSLRSRQRTFDFL